MSDWTRDEMMTVAASRLLWNGCVCFVGIGLPSAACNLARLTHAPDIVLVYESGTLGTRLRTRLTDAMNNGGAANAVQVCAAEAQPMAEAVAKETGARVGRSSVKLRNPKDAPPGWVQTWLLAQGDKKAEAVTGIEGVFDSPTGKVARFLKPIAIEGACLSCHGDPAQMSEPIKAAIAAKYPDDKATGYQNGDLRGALWAEVPVAR